jgi:hypothetical protein
MMHHSVLSYAVSVPCHIKLCIFFSTFLLLSHASFFVAKVQIIMHNLCCVKHCLSLSCQAVHIFSMYSVHIKDLKNNFSTYTCCLAMDVNLSFTHRAILSKSNTAFSIS